MKTYGFQSLKFQLLIFLPFLTFLAACKPPDEGAGKIGPIKKWGVALKDRVQSTPTVDKNGTIYVGSSDQHLYAFSSRGRLKWSYKADGQVLSPSIAPDGSIVFNTDSGFVTCLEPDGRKRWSRRVRKKLFGCPPAITQNGLIITAGDLVLVSLHLKNGKAAILSKKFPLVQTCPVLAPDGKTFYFGDSKMLYAWSIKGTKKWDFVVGSSFGKVSFDKRANLYFGTFDARIISLTPQGKKRWTFKAPPIPDRSKNDPPTSFISVALDSKDNVYSVRYDVGLYSLTPRGKLRWFFPQKLRSFNSHIAINKDDFIYVGSFDHNIYAFTPNGKLHYRFQTNERVGFGAAFSPDHNTLYIGSFDGHLYALHTHKLTTHSSQ